MVKGSKSAGNILGVAEMVKSRRRIGGVSNNHRHFGSHNAMHSPYAGWRDYWDPLYNRVLSPVGRGLYTTASIISPAAAWAVPQVWNAGKVTGRGIWNGTKWVSPRAVSAGRWVGRAGLGTARAVGRGAVSITPRAWAAMRATGSYVHRKLSPYTQRLYQRGKSTRSRQ